MRKKKWLRRGLYLVAFLILLYVVFTIALFNPLEGDAESLAAMVPGKVSYMIHSPWGKLRNSSFFRGNVTESPVATDVERVLGLEEYLYQPIRQVEEEVNAQMPSFLGEFSILEDLVGREVLIAGNLNGQGANFSEKVMNSPFVALTRISYKARFMDVLKYDFVLDKIPNLKLYRDIFEVDVGAQAVRPGSPESARYRYFRRIKDVLILSNDRELIQEVSKFGLAGSDAKLSDDGLLRNYWFYFDIGEPSDDAGITSWFRISRADLELGGEFEEIGMPSRGRPVDFLKAFFPVGLTRTVSLRLGVEGDATIPIDGAVRMADKREDFPDRLWGFHHEEGEDLREGVGSCADMIPLEGTFCFTRLHMAPRDALLSVFAGLSPADRRMLFGEQAENGTVAWDEQSLAGQIGDWFRPGVGVALSRLPEADDIDLDTYDGGVPEPRAAITLFLDIKEQLAPDDFLKFMKRNYAKLRLDPPEEKESAKGRLFKLKTVVDASLALLEPGFAMDGRRVVFSTNMGELTRILETAADRRDSLSSGEAFKEALERSIEKSDGNGDKPRSMFFFLDGAGARKWFMDQRWNHAYETTNYNAVDFRKKVILELNRQHRDWDTRKLNDEADRRMDLRERTRQESDFPAAVQEYRNRMYWLEPLDWFSLSAGVEGDTASQNLGLKGTLRLRKVGNR